MARPALMLTLTVLVMLPVAGASASPVITVEHVPPVLASPAFLFEKIPPPARDDCAAAARWAVANGRLDANGGGLARLTDGALPGHEDQPGANCFFGAGTGGGVLLIDLGRVVEVESVNTYSWHPGARGPQVYRLYGSLDAPDPAPEQGPDTAGRALLASVDTRTDRGGAGGQYGVSIAGAGAPLGRFRCLYLAVEATDGDDPFGNTFFSEIDVVEAGATVQPVVDPETVRRTTVVAADVGARIVIDTSAAPDLSDWADETLAPVVRAWYPRIAAWLASDGFTPPDTVAIVFSGDMQGVAATSGTRIRCAADWFRRELDGEAAGAVVHELVHVVQQYRRRPGGSPTPGWLVEGLCDYIRWFLYEPESRGAVIPPERADQARHDGSYRITANFLNWAVSRHGHKLIVELNAAAREGRYEEAIWADLTGLPVEELASQWRRDLAHGS